MDRETQAVGEGRVRDYLIRPLELLGLGRPTTQTQAQFEAMKAELCAKLAYMTEGNLAALREVVQESPGGPQRDRFPIALQVLKQAAAIQPPPEDASPFIRAVFGHALGRTAVEEGWGPELLRYVRSNRKSGFPSDAIVRMLKYKAAENQRQLTLIAEAEAAGRVIDNGDLLFRTQRAEMDEKCRALIATLDAEAAA